MLKLNKFLNWTTVISVILYGIGIFSMVQCMSTTEKSCSYLSYLADLAIFGYVAILFLLVKAGIFIYAKVKKQSL